MSFSLWRWNYGVEIEKIKMSSWHNIFQSSKNEGVLQLGGIRYFHKSLTWRMYHLFEMQWIFPVTPHAIWAPLSMFTGVFSFHCSSFFKIFLICRTYILFGNHWLCFTVTLITIRNMMDWHGTTAAQRCGLLRLFRICWNKIYLVCNKVSAIKISSWPWQWDTYIKCKFHH